MNIFDGYAFNPSGKTKDLVVMSNSFTNQVLAQHIAHRVDTGRELGCALAPGSESRSALAKGNPAAQ